MTDRWGNRTPLTGVLFVALAVIGGPVLAGSSPDAKASGAHVIAFYEAHHGRERAGVIVLAFAFVAFLFFAGSLRSRWRGEKGVEGLAAILLAAAGVLVVGETVNAGVGFALTEAPHRLTPAAAQTLNLLDNDLVLTSAVGFFAFGITAGLAILRGALMPAWLGWLALVIGILFVLGPLEFVGFVLLLVWVIVVSVLLSRQNGTSRVTADLPAELA